MKKVLFIDIVSCLYALLFLYTGINKLISSQYFLATLEKSTLLRPYSGFLLIAVPVLELIIALALILPLYRNYPRLRTWGLYSGTILMALFTGYVFYMIKFMPSLPCSCGGIIKELSWHQHLYFNFTFVALGIIACWLNKRISKDESNKLAFT